MFYLSTIQEDDESETLLQEPGVGEGGGQKEPDEPSPHDIRTSRHDTDSHKYTSSLSHFENDSILQDKDGDRNFSIAPAPVALKELHTKSHDEPNNRLSPSTPRKTRRSSSSTQMRRNSSTSRSPNKRKSTPTPQSFRRTNSSTPSQRRTSSDQSTPLSVPHKASRRRYAGRSSEPVVGKSDAPMTTSSKRTAPSTAAQRHSARRRQHTQVTPEHNDLPAPQWVINLMFDIEEATRHELNVEYGMK
ncbi:uncharacterized protein Hap1MRO34_006901 [Clarias gariepinus]